MICSNSDDRNFHQNLEKFHLNVKFSIIIEFLILRAHILRRESKIIFMKNFDKFSEKSINFSDKIYKIFRREWNSQFIITLEYSSEGIFLKSWWWWPSPPSFWKHSFQNRFGKIVGQPILKILNFQNPWLIQPNPKTPNEK